ncbi:hypothetical protein PENDEC_c011G04115 [Penicillium decumbens]|uniref:BTB domain-containing protein n=1 Tax=Penicillium decumbens TaxID=69771 RepID=A0A1V6PC39_PENDC|nr:hypothetical protein PENDEC_c011G04115 [Penicillium decumbens]
MAEITDNEPSTVVNIAAAGDLVLVIGPEKLKLRVHSLILKTASKPLAAMLGLNWKEGRDMLGADKPVELLLPEDSATALKYICAIIHYQNNTVPKILGAHDILDIAITAGKYDLLEPLTFATETWLRAHNKEPGDLMALATVAFLFQNAQVFKAMTKALILDYGGSYLALLSEDIESMLSWRVFCKHR